jgi:hypothetical protein
MGLARTAQDDFGDWPLVGEALLEALHAAFPEKCIGENDTPEQAHRYAGKVELIRFLQMVHDMQVNKED